LFSAVYARSFFAPLRSSRAIRDVETIDVAQSIELKAGELANLPEGSYRFEVEGAEELEEVLCWELPPGFRGE
jgi:hypothetical protein